LVSDIECSQDRRAKNRPINKEPIVMAKNSFDYMAIGQVISIGLILVPAADDHVK
jgi:hypothetical protein